MAKINLRPRIRLKFDRVKFRNSIMDQIAAQMNDRFSKIKSEFRTLVKDLVYNLVSQCADARNLRVSGIPSWELGLKYGTNEDFIDAVSHRVAQSTLVRIGKIRRVGPNFGGKITISMIKEDYSDVYGLTEANFVTEKGDTLPRLKWILEAGDSPLLQTIGYRVNFKSGSGRSHGATMVETDNPGEYFHINSSYSGVADDNWLTRAIKEGDQYLRDSVCQYIQQRVFN